jgi:hypothetical protein
MREMRVRDERENKDRIEKIEERREKRYPAGIQTKEQTPVLDLIETRGGSGHVPTVVQRYLSSASVTPSSAIIFGYR